MTSKKQKIAFAQILSRLWDDKTNFHLLTSYKKYLYLYHRHVTSYWTWTWTRSGQ